MLVTGSAKSLLDGGEIRIFDGGPPSSARRAENGNLLVTIQSGEIDLLLDFDAVLAGSTDNPVMQKDLLQIWSGIPIATGAALYYRYVKPADIGNSDPTQIRVQGLIGTSGADLNMTNVNIVTGQRRTLQTFSISLLSASGFFGL